MPLWNDACMKRMMFIGFSLKNELPMARLYSFHAFPLKFQMGERLMSPRNVGVVFCMSAMFPVLILMHRLERESARCQILRKLFRPMLLSSFFPFPEKLFVGSEFIY